MAYIIATKAQREEYCRALITCHDELHDKFSDFGTLAGAEIEFLLAAFFDLVCLDHAMPEGVPGHSIKGTWNHMGGMIEDMKERKSLKPSARFAILKRDGFTCQYCGARAPSVRLEVDHIFPLSKGGSNDPANLKTACWDCNRGKSDNSHIHRDED